MPKAEALYELVWDPPPRLVDALKRRGYETPWEMPYEAYRQLHDDLTLAEGRTELDRWARALHAEGDLGWAMAEYGRDFAYETPVTVRQYTGISPDKRVAIYRAVGKDMPNVIKPGDWVALERHYAASHGRGGFDEHGGAKVLSAMVPARDVAWAGTSADEWIFAPQEFRSEMGVHDALVEYGRLQSRLGGMKEIPIRFYEARAEGLIGKMIKGFIINPINERELLVMEGNMPIAGVTIRARPQMGKDYIHIEDLRAMERGGGRKAMEILIERADRHGAILTLLAKPMEPVPEAGKKLTKRKLKQWYKSFGFEPHSETHSDYMVRHPQGAPVR